MIIQPPSLRGVALCAAVLLCVTRPAMSEFSPGPDPKQVAAERQKLAQLRDDVGDRAMTTYLVGQLDLIARALPRWHPLYEQRSLQAGTGEHLVAARPHFATAALELLAECGDERALPTLEVFIRIAACDRVDDRFRYMALNWSDYTLANRAWLAIAKGQDRFSTHPATVLRFLDLGGDANDLIAHIADGMQRGSDPPYLFYDPHDILLVSVATGPYSTLYKWNTIEGLAELRAFDRDAATLDQMLTHENESVRAAVIMVLYRGDVAPLQRSRESWANALLELDEEQAASARAVHAKIVAAWNKLIEERRALDTRFAEPGWKHQADRMDVIMDRLADMACKPAHAVDGRMLDQIIDSMGWSTSTYRLEAAIKAGKVTPTADQWQRIAVWLDNPMIAAERTHAIAKMLLNLRHAPSADAVIRVYRQQYILRGLDLHPLYVAEQNRFRSSTEGPINPTPDWLLWLREHAGNPAMP